ncbi:hypothetical protein JST97_14650 [bacterium]|nr:hypothetical protein [bacterium]
MKLLITLLVTLGTLYLLAPWNALRGQLLEVQGRVTDVNPAARSLTVLDQQTSQNIVLQLGRDAFEPGQGWKALHCKPKVNVMATYNLDGSVQARRVVLL